MAQTLTFRHVLSPDGLLADRSLILDEQGRIAAIEPAGERKPDGYLALPGMPNAHSHAFQRAMSGYGERVVGEDSFWSWREAMYRLANAVDPEAMYVIARMAFTDMLKAGFTSLAEFHYLHHLPDGKAGPEMGRAVREAARDTGLKLTLLPVLYQSGGFGMAAKPEQRRFLHADLDSFLRLLERLREDVTGVAMHSLRAVPPEHLAAAVAGAREVLGDLCPVHIHISEQTAEVEACLAAYGKRPIALLADTVELDTRWHLVHATHADADERRLMLEAGATAVLCPITEAYLGDGLFAADSYYEAGGRLAVGSDSNCRIDAFEELRWLEYGQRLHAQRRARLADASGLGQPLWAAAAAGGAAALGRPVGALAPGRAADLVVIDEAAPALLGHGVDTALDALIVNGGPRDIAAVYVDGRLKVEAGRHLSENGLAHQFDRTVRAIYSKVN